jgi:virulence-associated protein VagC
MALTEATVEDKFEVVGTHRVVRIRTARVIDDDGVEISRSFSRRILLPSTKSGDTWSATDISNESAEVQGICNAVWTDAIRISYQDAVDA